MKLRELGSLLFEFYSHERSSDNGSFIALNWKTSRLGGQLLLAKWLESILFELVRIL